MEKAISTKEMMPLFKEVKSAESLHDSARSERWEAHKRFSDATRFHVEHKEDLLFDNIKKSVFRADEQLEERTAILNKKKEAFEAGTDVLRKEIKFAEGRAKARTITPYDILSDLDDITSRLDIPKKYMDGIKVCIDRHADTFGSAYTKAAHGTRPTSTIFCAEFKRGNWYITDIRRDYCGRQRTTISLTEAAKNAIIERIGKGNI